MKRQPPFALTLMLKQEEQETERGQAKEGIFHMENTENPGTLKLSLLLRPARESTL